MYKQYSYQYIKFPNTIMTCLLCIPYYAFWQCIQQNVTFLFSLLLFPFHILSLFQPFFSNTTDLFYSAPSAVFLNVQFGNKCILFYFDNKELSISISFYINFPCYSLIEI